ncbi:HPr-rel-A system PqqD family peptide chaperone [Sphingomonas sp. PR090111-T3T-6A]|uniref:HPr-rel-A system PqqD family peptide chaperone n=1 Tax=Sphingomonas sp. PR090111-T3T-6A TaxID=685778 RepID=UPI0003680F79|nr:HPr-rel-A system PqqD family peptide chaperone [Sphingomonas sp. PR090111-T3T-6A]
MTMPVYAADPPSARAVAVLDALVAVLHRPSGATHLLASPAPELLDALAEGPADVRTLLERLSRQYDLIGSETDAIEARMEELVAAGLVWRA